MVARAQPLARAPQAHGAQHTERMPSALTTRGIAAHSTPRATVAHCPIAHMRALVCLALCDHALRHCDHRQCAIATAVRWHAALCHPIAILTGGVVVDDSVGALSHGNPFLDDIEETDELLMAMALHVAADHRARRRDRIAHFLAAVCRVAAGFEPVGSRQDEGLPIDRSARGFRPQRIDGASECRRWL